MDAFAVERYRYLLAALAVAALFAVITAMLLARRTAPPELDEGDEGPARATVLPFLMLLAVALATGAGLILLLPVVMIASYFPGWPVTVLLVAAVLLLMAPLVYAWRSRPF